MDTDFLLVSLVDPSFTIRKEYMPFIVETKDGRVLNGLIVDRTPGAVTLVDAKNEKTVINMSEVKELRESSVSIMPEDLLKEMKPEEFRDLFSFLQSASGKP
ncbi:hypothetical protein HYR69_01520 [Candidatus Sumerlaeota bacterium]|nr:hypothetical protein [Candidatus Sumerlaeota bacterium]